jgi:hypothetical protein
MTVHLPGLVPPEGATVSIHIELTSQVNITPYVAKQKVNVFVRTEISSQLRAATPELRVGERLCWSVPIELVSPGRGVIGRVGELLVDAETGEVLAESESVGRIAANAEDLARRSPL